MALKVIADLHSATDALKNEVSPEDILLLLGDLVNIVDYREMSGIMVRLYGEDVVRQVVDLRAAGRIDEARLLMASTREGKEAEFASRFGEFLRKEYRKVFAAIPCPAYLVFGNVDHPKLIEELKGPGVVNADGMVVPILGLDFGFVAGGLPTPLQIPGEVSEERYDSMLMGLGEVDVVCSHIPPAIPELTYDTLAKRSERGSVKLIEYITRFEPRLVLFGHVHQPLISSMHIGRTHVVNAGYFRRTKRAIELPLWG
ncbi:MAG TPA: metallophosphoesterase [Actinomycetota bacterium]|nr:metallophosphoesterase [Actinomycetota bacterium]